MVFREKPMNTTGSHEVRGSIPLGSTNKINNLETEMSYYFLSHTKITPDTFDSTFLESCLDLLGFIVESEIC